VHRNDHRRGCRRFAGRLPEGRVDVVAVDRVIVKKRTRSFGAAVKVAGTAAGFAVNS